MVVMVVFVVMVVMVVFVVMVVMVVFVVMVVMVVFVVMVVHTGQGLESDYIIQRKLVVNPNHRHHARRRQAAKPSTRGGGEVQCAGLVSVCCAIMSPVVTDTAPHVKAETTPEKISPKHPKRLCRCCRVAESFVQTFLGQGKGLLFNNKNLLTLALPPCVHVANPALIPPPT